MTSDEMGFPRCPDAARRAQPRAARMPVGARMPRARSVHSSVFYCCHDRRARYVPELAARWAPYAASLQVADYFDLLTPVHLKGPQGSNPVGKSYRSGGSRRSGQTVLSSGGLRGRKPQYAQQAPHPRAECVPKRPSAS